MVTAMWSGVAACGGGGTTPLRPIDPTPHETFDVTWRGGTKVIAKADGKARLIGTPAFDRDTGYITYVFDGGATAVKALRPGDVAVLAGIAYRRVVAVNDRGDTVELVTRRIRLPEAIRSGTLEWSKTIDFASPVALAELGVTARGRPLQAIAQAQTGAITFDDDLDDEYRLSVTLTPSPSRLDFDIVVGKTIAGERRFALQGTGFISGFRSEGRLVISDGGEPSFQQGSRNIQAEFRMTAAAFNAGGSQDLIDLPIGIDIPLEIGPVPMVLHVTANVNVTLELDLFESSAQASADFRFSGSQGFSMTGGGVSVDSNLDAASFENVGGESAAAFAVGMTACVEAPRVELSMLGEGPSVGLTQNNCAQASLSFDPPCNEVNGSVVGKALYNVGFFGFDLASGDVELYRREFPGIRTPDCPPR